MKGDPGGMGTIRLAGGTIRLALTDAKSLCLLLILKTNFTSLSTILVCLTNSFHFF